jgi:hypothetical protein
VDAPAREGRRPSGTVRRTWRQRIPGTPQVPQRRIRRVLLLLLRETIRWDGVDPGMRVDVVVVVVVVDSSSDGPEADLSAGTARVSRT